MDLQVTLLIQGYPAVTSLGLLELSELVAGYYQRSTSTRPAAQNSRERNILAMHSAIAKSRNRKRDPPRSLFFWFRALCMACLTILRMSERRLLI